MSPSQTGNSSSGKITGIRYYRGQGNSHGYTVALYDRYGKQLAFASLAQDSCAAPCWEQVSFPAPVSINGGGGDMSRLRENVNRRSVLKAGALVVAFSLAGAKVVSARVLVRDGADGDAPTAKGIGGFVRIEAAAGDGKRSERDKRGIRRRRSPRSKIHLLRRGWHERRSHALGHHVKDARAVQVAVKRGVEGGFQRRGLRIGGSGIKVGSGPWGIAIVSTVK